jgi:lysophospholipase L1-like esterase
VTRRARIWLGNALLLLAAVAGTLAGFEAILRLALPQKLYRYPYDLFRQDPEIGFVLNPGFSGELRTPEFRTHLTINSLGFRNEEIAAKPKGVSRVLVVGDSFVSALNVESGESFVSMAGAVLARRLGPGRVEVVNAGTPNYGTWHELRVLRRFARSLEIDVAVLCVFVGNDLEDNLRPLGATVRDGYLVERQPGSGLLPRAVRTWLQRNSMAYVFLWSAYDRVRDRILGRTSSPLGRFEGLVTTKDNAQREDAYRQSGELLREATDFLAGFGIPLVVVIIPQELQVYPEKFASLASGIRRHDGDAGYDLTLPNRRWAALAESLGLPTVDLLPLLRTRNSGPPLYMSLDGHLTVEGNKVVGEALASALIPLLAEKEPAR